MGGKPILAVDLGATNIRVALINESGKILKIAAGRTPVTSDPSSITEAIINLAKSLGDEHKTVESIGVASIGPLDIREGVIINPPNLPYSRVPLREPLQEYFRLEVHVLNDCMAGALAEHTFGDGRSLRNLVYITFSTGIGGGAIVDGRLLVGYKGNAHEIGHIVVDYLGRLKCGCGGLGHWEGYCSGKNLPKLARLLSEETPRFKDSRLYKLIESGRATSKEIFEYARRGDALGLAVLEEFTTLSAAGLASVASVYDPQVMYLGGALYLRNRDLIDRPLREKLNRFSLLNSPPLVKPTSLGEEAVLLGAAAAAILRWRPD